MPVQLPKERAYYPASRAEAAALLCWVPKEELKKMVRQKRAPRGVLKDYPNGLEVEVSEEGLQEAGVDLRIDPEKIRKTYARLKKEGELPKSGSVQAAQLERVAKAVDRPATTARPRTTARRTAGARRAVATREVLREPKMSKGDDPKLMFRRLSRRGGRPNAT